MVTFNKPTTLTFADDEIRGHENEITRRHYIVLVENQKGVSISTGWIVLTSTRVLIPTALKFKDITLRNMKRDRNSTYLVSTPVLIAYRQRLLTIESDLHRLSDEKADQCFKICHLSNPVRNLRKK